MMGRSATGAAVRIAGAAAWLLLPSLALAAEGEGGGGWGALLEIGRLANLVLVFSVLVWIARKPLANFFAGRSQTIREQLAEAQRARKDAEAKLAEISARMASLDDELKEIRAAAEREAEAEYQRLTAEAEKDAHRVLEQARREIEGMSRAAQIELRTQAAELAVALARRQIEGEMTDADHRRLFTNFVASLGGRP